MSQNPDSILIEAPASLLNGKYSVVFDKETPLAQPPQYLLILKTDSTRLCFTKAVADPCNLLIISVSAH